MLAKRVILLLVLVLIVAGTLILAYAADGNNTDDNPDDNNACYEGGDWADGRCVNDWFWNAGWYRQAVIEGRVDASQVPDTYNSGVLDYIQSVNEPAATPEI